jgi:phosphoribosylanthranilate isomerase
VKGTTHPRVKICCIRSTEEARLAIDHGAAAVGLVSRMPSGPGVIAEPVIAEIAAVVPPGVSSFLLTSHQSSAAIVEQQRRLRTSAIQICDDLLEGTHADLRAALPGIALVQVIHVTGEDAVAKARAIAPSVDAILLDLGTSVWQSESLAARADRMIGRSAAASEKSWTFPCSWRAGCVRTMSPPQSLRLGRSPWTCAVVSARTGASIPSSSAGSLRRCVEPSNRLQMTRSAPALEARTNRVPCS